jgi:hypothetical protein
MRWAPSPSCWSPTACTPNRPGRRAALSPDQLLDPGADWLGRRGRHPGQGPPDRGGTHFSPRPRAASSAGYQLRPAGRRRAHHGERCVRRATHVGRATKTSFRRLGLLASNPPRSVPDSPRRFNPAPITDPIATKTDAHVHIRTVHQEKVRISPSAQYVGQAKMSRLRLSVCGRCDGRDWEQCSPPC